MLRRLLFLLPVHLQFASTFTSTSISSKSVAIAFASLSVRQLSSNALETETCSNFDRLASMSSTDWKKDVPLSKAEAHVIWDKGTERAGSGEYNKLYPKEGHFACKVCKTPLYSAQSKFDSGCGWPAFDKCYEGAITTHTDVSHGMKRVEIVCSKCGAHMGHVFEGEGMTSSNERHCVNSISVVYVKEKPDGLKEKPVLEKE
jgi:peptide-methionine (R)-S-oxide reductase